MIHEHVLGGCTPTPLAHYLKALGILRLVAEQKDSDAAGRWQGEQFVLRTFLSQEELERFFLEEYQPSPIVAPWNGGSGFYPNDNKAGIDAIAASTAERFQFYKTVIVLSRSFVVESGLEESPKNDEKMIFLGQVRAKLPDFALAWFDAAVMLATEKPDFPPLLGTGGNDGRLDFTNNFMQRVTELFNTADGKPSLKSTAWLKGSLHGSSIVGLLSKAIGQFSPGNAGGPNSTTGFDSESLMNPWDFVLMLEGAILFAGAVTRRLEGSGHSTLSYPFTVRTTGTGTGCGAMNDEQQSRAEIWMPLWRKPITHLELRTLLSEGRVTLGRRSARDGLDFARAISGFGVDRGISDFQRYAFLMRSGKAYLATPLARILVNRNPQADLITHLDRHGWLERLRSFSRKDTAPGRIRQLVHRLEDEIFSLTRHGGALTLQNILSIIGQIQLVSAESPKTRDAVAPVPVLGAEWASEADDGSNEFRIAAALAGLDAMRGYILPLAVNEKSKRTEWATSSATAVWGGGNLVTNLLRVLERRLLEMQRNQQEDKPFSGSPAADIASVMVFLHGETDDLRLAELFTGLVNVNLPKQLPERDLKKQQPPAVFSLLKPLFTSDRILHRIGLLPETMRLPLSGEIVPLLKTGNSEQTAKALAIAWRRLRSSGVKLPQHPRKAPELIGIDSARLAASLMIPLATSDLAGICKTFIPAQETN